MLNRLIDLLLDLIALFYFGTVVAVYERAVVLRLGKFSRELQPGFHWVWPFAIEEVLKVNVVPESNDLPAQALTTADGRNIVASAVVVYRVRDVRKLLLETEDAETVLADASRGTIRQHLCRLTWDEIRQPGSKIDDDLTRAVRSNAFRWGIEVLSVMLSDLSRTAVLRLVHDTDSRRSQFVDEE